MKKWMRPLLAAMMVLSIVLSPVSVAAEVAQKVHDGAGLFTAEEAAALEEKAGGLVAELAMDFVVVTTDYAAGKTAQDYADDFFMQSDVGVGEGKDGMLLLIDMDNREAYISTHALALQYFNDAEIERLLDDVFEYLGEGDYYGAADAFLNSAGEHVRQRRAADAAAADALPEMGSVDPAEKVYDYVDVLSGADKDSIAAKARAFSDETGVDMAVVYLPSTAGQSLMDYAEAFYTQNGFGTGENRDGVLLAMLLTPDGRVGAHITAQGKMRRFYSDYALDSMAAQVVDNLEGQNYTWAAERFISDAKDLMVDPDAPKPIITFKQVMVCLIIGFGAAGVVLLVLVGVHYGSMPKVLSASKYIRSGQVALTAQTDVFTGTYTQTIPRPKPPPPDSGSRGGGFGGGSSGGGFSGGGSSFGGTSSHRSSGGGSFGGGGRKF